MCSSLSKLILKPKLVFGRLGGGMASFSRAVDSVNSEDLGFDGAKMLEPPIDGLFTGEVPARCLIGDTGSGILEGDGGGRCTQVDDDGPVIDDKGAGLAFMKETSDVCLNLIGSGKTLTDELSKFETFKVEA